MDKPYTTHLPFFVSCPLCGQLHYDSKEVAECWKPELWFQMPATNSTEKVQGGK